MSLDIGYRGPAPNLREVAALAATLRRIRPRCTRYPKSKSNLLEIIWRWDRL